MAAGPSEIPTKTAIVTTLGGQLISTNGGMIVGPPSVISAGSTDAVATLYDGLDATGTVIAKFSLAETGAAKMSHWSYKTGLYVNVTGTAAAWFTIVFTALLARPQDV